MQHVVPRSLGVLAMAALLALSGLAAAQTASVTVTPATEAISIEGGQSSSVDVDVTLRLDQFSCLQSQTFPVNVSVSGARGVTGTPSPATLEYQVPQGIHDSSTPAGAYNETQTTTVSIQAPSGQAQGFSADVTVTGLFPGANPQTCGPNAFPQAEGSGAITVDVQPDVSSGNGGGTGGTGDGGTGGTGGNGTTPGTNTSDGGGENGTPMPAWIVPAALTGAAAILRRRS